MGDLLSVPSHRHHGSRDRPCSFTTPYPHRTQPSHSRAQELPRARGLGIKYVLQPPLVPLPFYMGGYGRLLHFMSPFLVTWNFKARVRVPEEGCTLLPIFGCQKSSGSSGQGQETQA